MNKLIIFLLSFVIGSTAHAGEYVDAMNHCIENSVTKQEKAGLARWFVASLARHPAMSGITSVSAEKKDELDKAVGQMNNRILAVACAKELKDVVRMEGVAGAKTSFVYLGQLAMQEVMTNPEVVAGMSSTEKYIDIAKINSVINSK